jgi:hypothetical protein
MKLKSIHGEKEVSNATPKIAVKVSVVSQKLWFNFIEFKIIFLAILILTNIYMVPLFQLFFQRGILLLTSKLSTS